MTPVPIRVHWLRADEGGRSNGLPGSPYPTVAHFPDEDLNFSVTLVFDPQGRYEHEASLTLLCPDRLPDVVERLQPGARLVIREGRRTVANCEILAAREATNGGPSQSNVPAAFGAVPK